MRGPVIWICAIVAGLVVLVLAAAAITKHNEKGRTVPAADYAQSICGAVGTWRGETKAIVDDLRIPPAFGSLGDEEPQSETPQGRTGELRAGLQEGVRATNTLVTGIEDAGIPDTPQGSEAASQISGWANSASEGLEKAQDSLTTKPETLEDAVGLVADAAEAVGTTLTSGVKTLTSVAQLDPQLAVAFQNSSTCQELKKKETSA